MVLACNVLKYPNELLTVLIECVFRNKSIQKEFLLLFIILRNFINLVNYFFFFFINHKSATAILFCPPDDLLYRFFAISRKNLIIISKLFEDG